MTTSADLIGLSDIESAVSDTQDAIYSTKQKTINLVDTRVGELQAQIDALLLLGNIPDATLIPYGLDTVAGALDDLFAITTGHSADLLVKDAQITANAAAISQLETVDLVNALDRTSHTGTQTSLTISDFDVAVDARLGSQKGAAFGVAPLNASQQIEAVYLPAIAITDTYTVADETARLALVCEKGDIAIQIDNDTTYILVADPPSVLGNWSELLSPGSGVTSVGLSLPVSVFGVTGTPVTATGTLTGTFNTQPANYGFLGPSTGSPATPSFRALVAADIPTLDFTKIGTGTVPVVQGGTGLTGLPTAGAILVGNNTNDGYNISSVVGTVNQVNVAASGAGIGLSLPQDIHSGASPTFASLTVTTLLTAGAQVLGRASVTTTYSVAAGVSTVFADATGGAFTVTLPSAVTNAGRIIRIKRTSTANNTVTVASAAGNVEGAATYALSGNGARPSATFASDGTNWWLVGASA